MRLKTLRKSLESRTMNERQKFKSMDEYILSTPPMVRPILKEIRRVIRHTVSDAKESISYQMPAFKLDRTFIYFAVFNKHFIRQLIEVGYNALSGPDLPAPALQAPPEKSLRGFEFLERVNFWSM
jgi:hypothetical protein